jgi:hypothetical protein
VQAASLLPSPAPSKRRRGAFAEPGAIGTGHSAQMRETEVECDVGHPLVRPGGRKPRVQMFEADVEQSAGNGHAEMSLEAELQ